MKRTHRLLSWAVTILFPLAFIFLGLRLVLTHAFLEIEYRLPNFPADEYGFSLEDRLHWSKISWDYMLNNEDISFLGGTYPAGSPLLAVYRFDSYRLTYRFSIWLRDNLDLAAGFTAKIRDAETSLYGVEAGRKTDPAIGNRK